MFCYQPEKLFYGEMTPGVYNSATELMTPELWRQMTTSPQTRWLTAKHREVKDSLDDARWAADADFLEYDRRMKRKRNSKAGKAYAACDSDAKRVAMWCDDLKHRLPFVIFVATYPERSVKAGAAPAMWRNQKYARLNGLVVLDVDHVEDPVGVFNGKWKIENGKWINSQLEKILLVYVTPGGHGLKVVFKADVGWGNLIDNQLRMAEILGVEADSSCKDAARGAFLTTSDDILYINEQELFTYENLEFAETYGDQYRRGDSQPTMHRADGGAVDSGGANSAGDAGRDAGTREERQASDGAAEPVATYQGIAYTTIIDAWLGGRQPGPAPEGNGESRHTTSLRLAYDLLVMTGRNKKLVERILRSLPWVDAIVRERGEPVDQTVSDADERVHSQEKRYGANVRPSKEMQAVVARLTGAQSMNGDDATGGLSELPLDEWGERIRALADVFPGLKPALAGLPPAGYAAGLFTTAAFLGTLMTRTWYYFYHRPEEQRRLNYCVMVIGDPASGKSFATRLYKLLAAPIKTADRVGYDAVNRYKAEMRTKGANKEKPMKPVVVIRDHPARTSNATFIQDMNNAVEVVDGEPMHLHMLTFDSELDNATLTQKGGSWIDKSSMELKAFHNEEDGQAYSNLDSVSGSFNVYWNYVYTGTPLSLQRKVTEQNFGSGLATRLACIPLPPSGFKMMALSRQQAVDHAADEELKTWAFRLDGVRGELPLWPLVEEAWTWTDDRMQVAAYNDDKADELLLTRVAYYGICIAAPFVVMRHWDEWQQAKTFDVDDTDRRLCRLAMDIQYRCQHHFFGAYARAYFDNMERDVQSNRQRASKYDTNYLKLPREFQASDVAKVYDISEQAAHAQVSRLCRDGFIERIKKGYYRKLKQRLI